MPFIFEITPSGAAQGPAAAPARGGGGGGQQPQTALGILAKKYPPPGPGNIPLGGGFNTAPPASPLHPVGLQPAPAPQKGQAMQPQAQGGSAAPLPSAGPALGGGGAGSIPSFPSNATSQEMIFWLQQIARMQQGMGMAMNNWATKDKAERQKLYDEIAKDRAQFAYLAKRIPDMIQSASPQTLQKVYNVSSPAEATQAMHREFTREDFSGKTGNVPQKYIENHAGDIVQDIADIFRVIDLNGAIWDNPQYSPAAKEKFGQVTTDHILREANL